MSYITNILRDEFLAELRGGAYEDVDNGTTWKDEFGDDEDEDRLQDIEDATLPDYDRNRDE